MRQKKFVEISNFANFDRSSNGVLTNCFYNYYPNERLNNSKGVQSALFPKSETNSTLRELNISAAGVTEVKGIAYFKQYQNSNKFTTQRLVIYGDNKKVYINQMVDDTWDLFWLYELTMESAPIVLSYKKDDKDAAIFANKEEMLIWKTGFSPYTITNVPIITSMCMNEGVLFCTIMDPAFKVWYATNLDPEEVGNISNNSGYISLDDNLGYSKKVIVLNEEVYVFREYGISKISFIRGEASVSQVYASNTLIYENTVSIIGDKILFMTGEGLYSFNGVKVTKTKIKLLEDLIVNNKNAVASSLGESYYLATNINFNDGKEILCEPNCVNNSVLIINTTNFEYQIIRGVDIKDMLPVKTTVFEKMLVIFNTGEVGKIGEFTDTAKCMEDNLPKFWKSDKLTDGVKTKLITKLNVVADIGVTFKIKYDDKEMDFTTYKQGFNTFMFKKCCKDVELIISSNEESAFVEKVLLEYYEY